MILLNSFDPSQDFWTSNPQLRILFKDQLDISSSHFWALFLYAHPDSKFYNESPEDRKALIFKDYLAEDPKFS